MRAAEQDRPDVAAARTEWAEDQAQLDPERLVFIDARLLYLPPYSPDFNPIEQLFAKLNALLRKAAERSVEALCNRIADLLDAFTSSECANYVRNAGYAPH